MKIRSKPISREKANKEIKKFIDLNGKSQKILKAIIEEFPASDDLKNFNKSRFNAFVFDIKSLKRFLPEDDKIAVKKTDKVKKSADVATHLVIILGAHDIKEDKFEEGTPTAIIAGVKIVKDSKGYEVLKTIFEDDPGDQYPEQQSLVVMPMSADKRLTFQFAEK